MSIISSSSSAVMREPLLSCKDCCSQEEYDHHDRNSTTRRAGHDATICSASSPPHESSTYFLHLWRPTLCLAGFMFGALIELAYAQTIHLGLTTPAIELPDGNGEDDEGVFSVLVKTWTDLFFYELSLLFADVMFLLYIVILIRYALKGKLNLSLPILAANWTVGVVLGLSATVALLVGSTLVLQKEWIQQVLLGIAVGISMCFAAYAAAFRYFAACHDHGQHVASSYTCEDLIEQDERTPVYYNAPSTTSLVEAHIV